MLAVHGGLRGGGVPIRKKDIFLILSMLLFVGRAEHLEEEPLTEGSTVLLLW